MQAKAKERDGEIRLLLIGNMWLLFGLFVIFFGPGLLLSIVGGCVALFGLYVLIMSFKTYQLEGIMMWWGIFTTPTEVKSNES